jgi:tRNA A-37 threonylcarbamoyl transferase component Bud32
MDGPYVLGDLRIGNGPLYVRYGAYAEMWCRGDGDEPVLAIEDHQGNLVPDRRGPVFTVPEWIEVPAILRPHLDARRTGSGTDFPYRVEEALHFSNGGGVYLARDRSGDQVVLREARPHAGLDRNRKDAVSRLGREHAALTRLAGLPCVPRVLDYRVVQDHHFLVEEYVEGMTLLRAIQIRSPTLYTGSSPVEIAAATGAYRDWALGVLDKVAAALDAVHARGVRFGDLHPANILLRPDGDVVLIDFEFAADLTDETPPGMGAPGFAATDGLTGAAVDLYALSCLRVFAFMMLTPLIDLDPAKVGTLVDEACRANAMPPDFGVQLIRAQGFPVTGPGRDAAAEMFTSDSSSWPRIRDSLVAGIYASATPERPDRLFPGSPAQFRTGGFDIAYGAAGVLLALHRVGATVPTEYLTWLVTAVERARVRPASGLYNGPHGVAAVLDALGRRDEALGVLDLARGFDRLPASDTLHAGNAGRALNLLHFARVTNNDALRGAALDIGAHMASRLTRGVDWPSGHGLLRGPSGPALLFIHLYEETRAERYLDLARQALERDLDQGATLADESFQLHVGTRNLAYLDGGSGGVALVLREYLRRRPDPGWERILTGIRRSCTTPFVYQPGLFMGRAGFMAILAGLGEEADRPALREHVRALAWHALLRDGNLVFPGDQLMRHSMDLATGSAGILLALHAVFEESAATLPYLEIKSPSPITST